MSDVSGIALSILKRDLSAALARVARGESLLVFDEGREIARITPPPSSTAAEPAVQSLVEFFMASPLRDSGLEFTRNHSPERPTAEL
jgi:antitoxin (DNA-binding transcriptional repressor) of toxin-antitoxin stability system